VQLARRYDGTVEFLGVAARDEVSAMADFVDRYDIPFPNIADVDAQIWKRSGVRGQPAWVFVDRNGRGRLFYRPDDATVRAELDRLARA
jgi:peroxiredoxin